jgi:hypothetical protein
MRQDTERLRRVPPLIDREAGPECQDGFIDSFGVVVSLHLEVPVERRPVSIREADAN